MGHNFIENQLVILTKQTLDIFLKQDNPGDLIALYTFYYYTAKWQETNQPKCTTSYVANGLHWSENKVRKAKKQLIEFGLIEDVQARDNSNKIIGHYVKMNYIFRNEVVENCTNNIDEKNHPNDFPQGGEKSGKMRISEKNHPNDFAQGGIMQSVESKGTNALSTNNINALSTNNKNALNTNNIKKVRKKEKAPEKKSLSFDSLIDSYTDNEELRMELKEHLKTRKSKKATMTNRAIELSLNKLDKISSSDEEKIQIVQNAIMSGWTTFYPLKENNYKPTNSYQGQRVTINGKEYIMKNGEYYIPKGSGIPVNPYAEDDLPF